MEALVVLFLILILGLFLWIILAGLTQWSANNAKPVLSEPARILTKRAHTSGSKSTSTWYYITFELRSGARKEFAVPTHQYGLLVVGDTGLLTHQGSRYKGFQRGAA